MINQILWLDRTFGSTSTPLGTFKVAAGLRRITRGRQRRPTGLGSRSIF